MKESFESDGLKSSRVNREYTGKKNSKKHKHNLLDDDTHNQAASTPRFRKKSVESGKETVPALDEYLTLDEDDFIFITQRIPSGIKFNTEPIPGEVFNILDKSGLQPQRYRGDTDGLHTVDITLQDGSVHTLSHSEVIMYLKKRAERFAHEAEALKNAETLVAQLKQEEEALAQQNGVPDTTAFTDASVNAVPLTIDPAPNDVAQGAEVQDASTPETDGDQEKNAYRRARVIEGQKGWKKRAKEAAYISPRDKKRAIIDERLAQMRVEQSIRTYGEDISVKDTEEVRGTIKKTFSERLGVLGLSIDSPIVVEGIRDILYREYRKDPDAPVEPKEAAMHAAIIESVALKVIGTLEAAHAEAKERNSADAVRAEELRQQMAKRHFENVRKEHEARAETLRTEEEEGGVDIAEVPSAEPLLDNVAIQDALYAAEVLRDAAEMPSPLTLDSTDTPLDPFIMRPKYDGVSKEVHLDAARARTRNSLEEMSPSVISRRFETAFGITAADLEQIEGFKNLSAAQQELIFEDLKEYSDRGRKPYMGAVWKGIKGAFGVPSEDVPVRGSTRGMRDYGTELKMLTFSAATFGPKVHRDEATGELVPHFVTRPLVREYRTEQKEVTDALNAAAHALTRVPASWQEDANGIHAEKEGRVTRFFKERFSGSRKRYRAYEETQKAYDDAKRAYAERMLETMKDEGMTNAEVVKTLVDVDAQVHMRRFVSTNPDAVALLEAGGSESIWKGIGARMARGGTLALEKGAYMGIGATSRLALQSSLEWMSGPAVAAALGGTRAWNKTAAEQRERDRAARMGKGSDPKYDALLKTMKDAYAKDPKGTDYTRAVEALKYYEGNGALNIVNAVQKIRVGGAERETGLNAKLSALVDAYTDSAERLEHATLMRDTEAITHWTEKKDILLKKMQARAQYTEDKLKLNRVQFGAKGEALMNQTSLFEVLGAAKMALANEGLMGRDVSGSEPVSLNGRLDRFMQYREGALYDRRKSEQRKATAKAAAVAGALGVAGALAADYVKGDGVISRATASVRNFGRQLQESLGILGDRVSAETRGVTSENSNVGAPRLGTHTIERGDTLTKIMKERIPALKGLTGHARESAIANVLASLTPEEMDRVGITSHNVDRIIPGKALDLGELQKIIEAKKSIIENAQVRFGTEGIREYVSRAGNVVEVASHTVDTDAMSEYEPGARVKVEGSRDTSSRDVVLDTDAANTPQVELGDLDTERTREIGVLKDAYVKKILVPKEWERLKGASAYDLFYMDVRPDMPQHDFGKEYLHDVVSELNKTPFKLIPEKKETIDAFLTRAFGTMNDEKKALVGKILTETQKKALAAAKSYIP